MDHLQLPWNPDSFPTTWQLGIRLFFKQTYLYLSNLEVPKQNWFLLKPSLTWTFPGGTEPSQWLRTLPMQET